MAQIPTRGMEQPQVWDVEGQAVVVEVAEPAVELWVFHDDCRRPVLVDSESGRELFELHPHRC